MLKFIKHHMDTIAGIGIYPVVSFLIFFSVFLIALLYVRKARRSHIDHMSVLPLADDLPSTEQHEHAKP
ncbi:MAG TPA: CcoQ/FixQ family Cbb3-type cytochrome c oxidase assembly chaperone [Flavobacteriales bacterium]|nr:CcoQ/FixQ family Cbb3-type cytochrome c oxidase assembly chaperone [Flavobacteriales bacterium]HRO38650.1 CcoQ/FixQ family Cbb3-type cytochrome c oxidase assembly chaperone [Flavobacteriales bacterium]HRP80989.1 CcoQ/FixQ family Cbb3-type cytochrome c oxidase assembly chaperone [Flavobacteriales bacterium]